MVMGRPKKWVKGWDVTSLMLYARFSEIYEKAKELAQREGLTFSEVVAKALHEYVEAHYPGNPQIPLEAFTDTGLKPVRLEARILCRDVERLLDELENPEIPRASKLRTKRFDVPPLLVKLSRLNLRLRDDGISALVERGEKVCFGEGGTS